MPRVLYWLTQGLVIKLAYSYEVYATCYWSREEFKVDLEIRDGCKNKQLKQLAELFQSFF